MKSRLAAAVFLLCVSGWAQETQPIVPGQQTNPQPVPPTNPQVPQTAPQAIPEAVQPQPEEPVESTSRDVFQAGNEYGGPAILSRGSGMRLGGGGEQFRIRPYVSVDGIYDSGLGTLSINQSGEVPLSSGYGVQLQFGVTGQHRWKRSMLELDYRGGFRHYNRSTYYDGFDNSLMLTYQEQVSRRLTYVVGGMGALYQRSFFLPAGIGLGYDPTLGAITANDLFDTPTMVLMGTGQLVYQKSLRLSFGIGGGGFIVRRRASGLIGVNGQIATGNIAYRLTRFQTLGIAYNFLHFDFQHAFGATDAHGLSLEYSVRLGRSWHIALGAGGYRVETKRIQTVTLDPIVAAILGQHQGLETIDRVVYLPRYQGNITRSFRRASASLSYTRTVSPGNGIYLTSGYETAMAGYSYSGFRRLGLFVNAGYYKFTSLSQDLGHYRSYAGGGGLSYKISRSIGATARFDARQYRVTGVNLHRVLYRAIVGLTWSPGDYPISFW